MKVPVIRTRVRGMLLPKGHSSRKSMYDGDLAIAVPRDNRLNHLSKPAHLLRGGNKPPALELMDVNLEWMNEEWLVLAGFEPYTENGQLIDYAQSWLCLVGAGQRPKTGQEQYEEQRFRTNHAQGVTLSNSK